MNHDPASDPVDARLSALYRAHLADDEQPSAATDARILALAQAAVARPAAKTAAPGWRSWLNASWFGPGLAFATIASLSVVIFSLIPKEEMSIERTITEAPGAPVTSAVPSATSAVAPPTSAAPSAARPAPRATATIPPATPAAAAESVVASSAAAGSGATSIPEGQSRTKPARANESARLLAKSAAPDAAMRAAPAPQAVAAPPAAAFSPAAAARPAAASSTPASPSAAAVVNAMPQRIGPARAPAPELEQPNPFPALSPPAAARRADPVAAGDAGPAQRQEKPSLLTEPTESRMGLSQPSDEVRDSAPTYRNEAQSSIPLPYTYSTPRAPARAAMPGSPASAGSLAGGMSAPQQSAATRKEAVAERQSPDKSASPAASISTPALPSTSVAAAPALRDPAEWIKAIQKLRAEGKSEQVTKELADFRRQYPQYPLPDELKRLVK